MPLAFDARHDSLRKRYRYRVLANRHRRALEERYAWHVRKPLDIAAMREAALHFVGEHDFNAFRSTDCDAPHARRHMIAVDIEVVPRPSLGEIVEIHFHANAYCRYMCRILAGTLVEVGEGIRTPKNVAEVLESRDRRLAGVTAPPHGLTLMQVFYP